MTKDECFPHSVFVGHTSNNTTSVKIFQKKALHSTRRLGGKTYFVENDPINLIKRFAQNNIRLLMKPVTYFQALKKSHIDIILSLRQAVQHWPHAKKYFALQSCSNDENVRKY